MQFVPLEIADAILINVEPHSDERGLFARVFSEEEYAAQHLPTHFPQCSTSFNHSRGTIRGLHYQRKPHEEAKVVRCTRGSIFDVIVDLRRNSPTFRHWVGLELTEDSRSSIFVPAGVAHGFQTLSDNAEVYYQINVPYVAEAASGIRWDDPTIGVRWPLPVSVISSRDAALPTLT
jgi:dTDP-4-dehydrorhamnose 3,5-epimerase